MPPTPHELYAEAKKADDAWHAALVAAYRKNAGDIRYQANKQTPDIRKLGEAYRTAIQRWRDAVTTRAAP